MLNNSIKSSLSCECELNVFMFLLLFFFLKSKSVSVRTFMHGCVFASRHVSWYLTVKLLLSLVERRDDPGYSFEPDNRERSCNVFYLLLHPFFYHFTHPQFPLILLPSTHTLSPPSLSVVCCAPLLPQHLRWRLNSRVIYCDVFVAAWFK